MFISTMQGTEPRGKDVASDTRRFCREMTSVYSLVASHETAGYIYLYGFIIPFYYGNVSRNTRASVHGGRGVTYRVVEILELSH